MQPPVDTSPPPSVRGRQQLPQQRASASILLGRRDYLSVLLRLVAMELYKLRRRPLTRVLAVVSLLTILLVFLALFLFSMGDNTGEVARLLLPPASLHIAVQTALTPFTILIIILAGSSAGGEYTQGTIRLLFTRGPTRTQFLLAKVAAILICCIVGISGMTLSGLITGYLLSFLRQTPDTSPFLTTSWLLHTGLFLLLAILNWFIFGVIALFFGILGRSSAAGIGGGIVWYLLEPIIGQICQLSSELVQGPVSAFLGAIPDYLIGNNLATLMAHQGYYIFGSSSSSRLPDLGAMTVLLVYIVLLLSVAAWLNQRRDITN
ncbi:ABC transporter permease [Thermogemmatispora sp.]|uniref:ABC transporter permease n=1 Tax=Thermogemmatispora sp. TaxID=1968838 RepID=UPI001DAE0A8E|nr:ABC transporter permease [Thermogemmatispora sp.]MBX5451913.1 ABC transporter permease [Thermogemmatispora sp.]